MFTLSNPERAAAFRLRGEIARLSHFRVLLQCADALVVFAVSKISRRNASKSCLDRFRIGVETASTAGSENPARSLLPRVFQRFFSQVACRTHHPVVRIFCLMQLSDQTRAHARGAEDGACRLCGVAQPARKVSTL